MFMVMVVVMMMINITSFMVIVIAMMMIIVNFHPWGPNRPQTCGPLPIPTPHPHSHGWHGKARRKRALARIWLRTYWQSGSPRSAKAWARIACHHGRTLPKSVI